MNEWGEQLVMQSTSFLMTWPKTKRGRKAFQDSDRASTSHYSEVERYSGGNTRRNFNQFNSASRPIELEGLKIYACPERILYDNITTKKVFEVLENHLKGNFEKTKYRNLCQAIDSCLSVPMAGMINAAPNLDSSFSIH